MGHGDAPRPEDHHKSGGGAFGPCVRPLRHAHRVHPAGHGRLVSVPTCSTTALVGLIVLTNADDFNIYSAQEYKYKTALHWFVAVVIKRLFS